MQDTDPTIERVFEQLDKWRHLPAYRLEPRADVFFSFLLPEVLETYFRAAIRVPLIPEFPVKRKDNNQSKKIDYLAVSEDGTCAFFIELKTDARSIDDCQMRFLKTSAENGLMEALEGIKKICKSPSVMKSVSTRKKYFHLLHTLSCLRLIDIPCGLQDLLFRTDSFSYKRYESFIDGIKAAVDKGLEIKVVYVLPERKKDMDDCIYQIDFSHLAKRIGHRFGKSLELWRKPAGSCPPQP